MLDRLLGEPASATDSPPPKPAYDVRENSFPAVESRIDRFGCSGALFEMPTRALCTAGGVGTRFVQNCWGGRPQSGMSGIL